MPRGPQHLARMLRALDDRTEAMTTLGTVSGGLSPIQLIAIRRLVAGEKIVEIQHALKLSSGVVYRWLKDPTFVSRLREAIADHEEVMDVLLIDAEIEAAKTLREALKAETATGKPAWETRVEAALSLLDRSGKRGPVVQRAQASVSVVDQTAALADVLRDPSVQAWVASAYPKAVAQIAAHATSVSPPSLPPAQAVDVVVEEDPTND